MTTRIVIPDQNGLEACSQIQNRNASNAESMTRQKWEIKAKYHFIPMSAFLAESNQLLKPSSPGENRFVALPSAYARCEYGS
jgi:hypothetical protein